MDASPGEKKPSLTLQLPLGVSLPSGVSIRFGDQATKALPFQTCNPNGCEAEYSPTAAEIAALQKGSQLELVVRTPNKSSYTFKVPATGFDAAYAKMMGK